MRVQRDEVDGDLAHVELERADALHRVAVERDAAVAADRADRGERLQRADLVVRVHDRDERGAVVDRRRDGGRSDATVWRDLDHGQPHVCVLGKVARGVEDRVMLDRRRHEAIALAATRLQRAAQREVVRLGAAAGEDDLARRRADRRRDLLARGVDEGVRGLALGVDARRIAGHVAVDARHRLGHLGVDGRRRGVIQVHACHRPKV